MLPPLLWVVLTAALTFSGSTKPGFPPSPNPGCLEPDRQPSVFCSGDNGYGCYKIPTVLLTTNGTLLAMIEARKYSCDDQGWVDLRLKRSFDSGATWGASQLVHHHSTADEWTTVGDANMVQDKTTGEIWLLHTRNNTRLFLSHSVDDGAAWSDPIDLTETLKFGFPSQRWIGTGHAGGIQLSAGPSKGRLIIPTYSNTSYTVYSDDHGKSWHIGGAVTGPLAWGAECQISETGTFSQDGTPVLMISMRNNPALPVGVTGKGYRLQALSQDGGLSWGLPWEAKDLPEPIKGCDGSIVFHPGTQKLYFSHPDPEFDLFRRRLMVWSSSNVGTSWEKHHMVWDNAAGYSALAVMTDNAGNATLGVLYDRNNHTMIVFEAQSVSFTTINA